MGKLVYHCRQLNLFKLGQLGKLFNDRGRFTAHGQSHPPWFCQWQATRHNRQIYGLLISVICLTGCDDLAISNPFAAAPASSFEIGLANHLQKTGAKMYGAYWCPHCEDQKAMFGQAVSQIPYVECDPAGVNPQVQLCRAKRISGYPTWEIRGRFYTGSRSLGELANLSHYNPPQ